jgi:5'-3' exonuclease
LGNDFLPHIPSLDIHHNGIENLIMTYISILQDNILHNNIEYLLNDINSLQGKTLSKINLNFLSKFINILSLQEENILKDSYINKFKRKLHNGDDYEKEIHKIENLQFKINDPIQLGSDTHKEWRIRYYKYYWDVNETEIEAFSENLVKHYLIGIKWITQYYFDTCPSWDWYFPYDNPPFITDIAKYLPKININKIKFNKIGEAIKPMMQLLTVLPPQSSYLLPITFKNVMNNIIAPYEFEQDFVNKKKYWMAIPRLPPLDIELIKNIHDKYEGKLEDFEKERNTTKKIFKFKPI